MRNLFNSLLHNARGILQATSLIKRMNPDLVIGAGGYVSGPVVLAAYLMGIKTVLHEQNTIPGLTNRILGKIVQLIFVSFEHTLSYFPKAKTIVVGNPVRKQSAGAVHSLPPPPFTLLIVGGSLGSHQINQVMIEALPHLLPIREQIKIIHQTGNHELTTVRDAYQSEGFTVEVVPFIDHIASAYQRAHLVICRAGATTLAELMVHHKPSILIPYPQATDRHQHLNAKELVDQHAAQMIDPDQLTGVRLAQLILHLYHHPEQLSHVGRSAGALARPKAAKQIVDYCSKLITGEKCTSA